MCLEANRPLSLWEREGGGLGCGPAPGLQPAQWVLEQGVGGERPVRAQPSGLLEQSPNPASPSLPRVSRDHVTPSRLFLSPPLPLRPLPTDVPCDAVRPLSAGEALQLRCPSALGLRPCPWRHRTLATDSLDLGSWLPRSFCPTPAPLRRAQGQGSAGQRAAQRPPQKASPPLPQVPAPLRLRRGG